MSQQDVDDAIAAHEASGDPHAAYVTDSELTGAIAAHAAAVDPHTTYALEANLHAIAMSGSASDLGAGTVAAARLPTFGAAAAGIVPQSGGGSTNYLRADGQWTAPAGGGGSSLPGPVSLGGYVVLTNVGASYDAIAQTRGLGFVEIDMTGIGSVVFTVQVNKIGTGTQSWQLWNETNAAQVGVIADAGAAGNKTLTTTLSGLALTGVKRLRVRALSTVAADDPVYYGASLRFG